MIVDAEFDRRRIAEALESADIVPLALSLCHLTGRSDLLDELQPFVHGPWDYSEQAPPELRARVRAEAAEAIERYLRAGRPTLPLPSAEMLKSMMSLAIGQAIPDEYVPMMLEQIALDVPAKPRRSAAPAAPADFRVLIIGAGMSGLCAAVKLKEQGIDFSIVEKNDTVGGTWYENSYPGCGVDTPNHFYSFSFEPNHDWSHYFSKRDELWKYFERCADRYDLRRHIRFRTEVTAATFDEASGRWNVSLRLADGGAETIAANAVISCVGQLNRPSVPAIPGQERFAGPAFHTAEWRHDIAIAGKRVAMIGTGASGMQTGPAIAGEVGHLSIFQRSPHWVVANPNYHRSVSADTKWVLRNAPYYASWYRFQLFWGFADGLHAGLQIDPDWHLPQQSLNAVNERHREVMIRHIKREIGDDPELLAKVVPPYPPYGKRILIDNHWYKMLKRPNVSLITVPIAAIEPSGVRTEDGVLHPVDIIVYATGFKAGRMLWPMKITGRHGANLRARWGDDDPRAYLGITVPDFPNFFMTYGPNTNLGHGGSAIFHTECQVNYIVECLRKLRAEPGLLLDCRQDVHDAYNRRVDEAHRRMVWSHPGMSNWYKNKKGRVITNSPWRLVDYWRMTSQVNFEDYKSRA